MNKVVVTGLGWTTALGSQLQTVWERLVEGQTGIRDLPVEYPLKNTLAGFLPDSDIAEPKARLLDLTQRTAKAALDDARVTVSGQNPRQFLIAGTSLGYRLDSLAFHQDPLHEWVVTTAQQLGLQPLALSTACSSGSDALMLGAYLIRAGLADTCVCGGADILGRSKRLAHTALGTMSATRLRAFDQHHDGTLLGEGAGFLVLERQGQEARKPYAYLLGCGSANDAAGLTAPDEQGTGIRLALDRSLEEAGIHRNQIGLVNAHGSGTLTNDRVESAAYADYFSGYQPIVFATKGAFGHTLGATGALEAIALVKSLQTGVVPPIHGLETPIANLDFRLPVGTALQAQAQIGLSLTIGFGGFNTSLVFQRYS
jgi:3-oxoacyl-[acyl-carrier-protein] synthase II